MYRREQIRPKTRHLHNVVRRKQVLVVAVLPWKLNNQPHCPETWQWFAEELLYGTKK